MLDYQTLGPNPAGEPCASIHSEHYMQDMRIETRAYQHQLIRKHGPPPNNAYYGVKSFNHDFGQYHELVIYYDDEDGKATDYAFTLDTDLPENWDDEAKEELSLHNYPHDPLEKASQNT